MSRDIIWSARMGTISNQLSGHQLSGLSTDTRFGVVLTCIKGSLLWVCAVQGWRFPVGASPTRQTLQPEAIGAVMEVTKWLT
jgi:hypothetical protein